MIKAINRAVCVDNIEYLLFVNTKNLQGNNNSHDYRVRVHCLDADETVTCRIFLDRSKAVDYYDYLVSKVEVAEETRNI